MYVLISSGGKLEKVEVEKLESGQAFAVISKRTLDKIVEKNAGDRKIQVLFYQKLENGDDEGKARILCMGGTSECLTQVRQLLRESLPIRRAGPVYRTYVTRPEGLFSYPSIF